MSLNIRLNENTFHCSTVKATLNWPGSKTVSAQTNVEVEMCYWPTPGSEHSISWIKFPGDVYIDEDELKKLNLNYGSVFDH